MPQTYSNIKDILGKTPKIGERIDVSGGRGTAYQTIEGVRTTPEGFTIVNLSPSIMPDGERQGRGSEFAYYGDKGFVGQSKLQDTPIDFSSSRIGTSGAIADLKYNVPSLPGYVAPPPQNRPVITGPRLGEPGAIPAEGGEFTFDPRFPGERLSLGEHQRRLAELNQPKPQTLGTAGAGQTVQDKIAQMIEQAKLIKEKVDILARAESAGLRIDPGTTVEEAERFLSTGSIEPPPQEPEPEPTPPPPGNLTPENITDVPENVEFKNTDAYKNLTPEEKEFIDMGFQLITLGGEQDARMFANAISQAKSVADPYFKAQISLTQAEIVGKVAELNLDFDTKKEIIERTQKELSEDVASQKEFLSLEQQADIARANKDLDQDLLSLRDQAAAKGITFSTISEQAQARAVTKTGDVVESVKRQSNFRVKELETKAARGDISAQKQLEAMRSGKSLTSQTIGRRAEEILGSSGIPGGIEDYVPIGGIKGQIQEEKQRAVLSDTESFISLQRGFL